MTLLHSILTRRSRHSIHRIAVALSILITLTLLPFALVSVSGDDATIDEQIYTSYINQGYCIRLTHQTDWIGCGLPSGGTSGRIRLCADQSSFDSLLADPPSDSVALLVDHSLLTRANLVAAREKLSIAGIMILPTDASSTSGPTPPVQGYSPGSRTPQYLPYIPSSDAVPDRPITTTLFNNSYVWNPLGEDIMHEQFEFAIVTVTTNEKAYLLSLAQKNEQNAAAGSFVYNMAQFHFYMYGKTSTPQCLSDSQCMPVGGYSVWGSLGNLTSNSTVPPPTQPFLLLTTKMDSAAFFHQLSPGGDESQASVAVLAAAVRVLSNTTGVGALPTQILFALFQGESYSHVGSRKFVDDIQHFHCTEPNTDPDVSAPACTTPYKSTLDFQNININRIDKIVEVGQIGRNATVFVHRQRLPANVVTDRMVQTVYAVAANLSTPLSVGAPDSDTPGIPPSCAEAFLDARASIATIVLTDHAGAYANHYLHSEFDLMSNTQADANVIGHPNLCAKATLLARTAWIEAGGEVQMSLGIKADCEFIEQLLNCLLVNSNCDMIHSLAPGAFGSPTPEFPAAPKYTSVYNLLPESFIDSMPFFMYRLFGSWVLNATSYLPPPSGNSPPDNWPAPPNNIHYHDAVDPNLVFDYENNMWTIKSTANDRYLYTESNWDSHIGWKTYRLEDPRIEIVSLVLGLVVAVVAVLSVGSMQKYCQKRFKRL